MDFQVMTKQRYPVLKENFDSGSKIALSNDWCLYHTSDKISTLESSSV